MSGINWPRCPVQLHKLSQISAEAHIVGQAMTRFGFRQSKGEAHILWVRPHEGCTLFINLQNELWRGLHRTPGIEMWASSEIRGLLGDYWLKQLYTEYTQQMWDRRNIPLYHHSAPESREDDIWILGWDKQYRDSYSSHVIETWQDRVDRVKREKPRAWSKWTAEDDDALITQYQQGQTVSDIANVLQRQPSAIRARIHKLGIADR